MIYTEYWAVNNLNKTKQLRLFLFSVFLRPVNLYFYIRAKIETYIKYAEVQS